MLCNEEEAPLPKLHRLSPAAMKGSDMRDCSGARPDYMAIHHHPWTRVTYIDESSKYSKVPQEKDPGIGEEAHLKLKASWFSFRAFVGDNTSLPGSCCGGSNFTPCSGRHQENGQVVPVAPLFLIPQGVSDQWGLQERGPWGLQKRHSTHCLGTAKTSVPRDSWLVWRLSDKLPVSHTVYKGSVSSDLWIGSKFSNEEASSYFYIN